MQRRPRPLAAPRIHAPTVVMDGAAIAPDSVVGAFCFVAAGAVIGAGSRIQGHTSVWDGVTLGEDVFVGPGAMFTNVRHPRAAFPRSPRWDRTVVEDGASIGAGSVIVAPVRIGRCAMVGAGAVVVRDVPAHAVVVGNPARVVAWACECGETVARGEGRPESVVCEACRRDEGRGDSQPHR